MLALQLACLAGCLLLGGCPAGETTVSEPKIEAGVISLQVNSPDRVSQPYYDRVDLLLLPDGPDGLPRNFESSTNYFTAIRESGGFYMGGDYLDDTERESNEALYELELPAGSIPAQSCSAWLICLELSGTALEIRNSIPVSGWP